MLKRNFKVTSSRFINLFVAVAVIAGTLTAGFVYPNIAQASCNPATQEQEHVTPSVSISAPNGNIFHDPGSISIAISGELAYYCEGEVPPGGGGFGYQNTATAVHYTITRDANGSVLFSNDWNSPNCPNPLACWPGPYNISNSADASLWEVGTYTITADVYDNTQYNMGSPGPDGTDTKHFTIVHDPGSVGHEIIGSIAINTFNPNPADNSVTVSGTAIGGYWDRGGPLCSEGGRSHAYIRMQLVTTTPANGPYPPGSSGTVNTAYHNQPVPNYPTTYKIDGNDAGTYPLALNYNGSDVPGDVNCETVPDPMGYAFSFPINTTNLTNGQHTVTVTAWDESYRTVISSTGTFTVQHVQNVLTCGATQTVQSGTPAQYAMAVTGNPSGEINVTMTSAPSGPTLTNSPVHLNAANSYTGIANVSTTGLAANTYHLTFTGNPGSLTCNADLIVTALPPPAPNADIKFNSSDGPVQLSAGTTSGTISWGNQNVTGCVASSSSTPAGREATLSPVWNNSYNVTPLTSGSQSVSGLQNSTTYTFNLHCDGAAGSNPSFDVDSVIVSVGDAPPPVPSVDIKCSTAAQPTPSNGPCTVNNDTSANLSWDSQNTSGNCTITGIPGNQPLSSSGIPTGNLTNPPGTYTFAITCPGVAGSNPPSATDSVVVNVNPPPSIPPTADLRCSEHRNGLGIDGPCDINRGDSGYLTWTSDHTNTCTLTKDGQNPVSVSLNKSVGLETDPITAQVTYTLTCTGNTAPDAVDSVILRPVDTTPPPAVDLKCIGDNGQTSNGPCDVVRNGTGHMIWASSHADNCSMTKDGNNIGPVSLSQDLPGMLTSTIVADTTYAITCTGPTAPPATDSVTFHVTEPPVIPHPTVDLKCIGSNGISTDGPCSVTVGTTGTLTWTSQNTQGGSCSIDHGIGVVALNNTTGLATQPITQPITYQIDCSRPGDPVDGRDSVTFNPAAIPEPDSFTVNCTPAVISLVQGHTDTFRLVTSKTGNFSSQVHFVVKTIVPNHANGPSVAIIESTNNKVPPAETDASVVTTGSTAADNYVVTFEGTGGGVTKQCSVDLQVTAAPPTNPHAPSVTTDNSQCDKVIVNWVPSNTPPPATGFTVFRGTSSNPNAGTWTDISGMLAPSIHSFVDTQAATTSNYYKVIAYNGAAAGPPQNPAVLGNKRACIPNIDRSDKDISAVSGKVSKNFTPTPCNANSDLATLPSNATFAVGDKVTFKINVCNSGEGAMTGITILDTLSNLENPTFPSSSCVTSHNYNAAANTISFGLKTIAPGTATNPQVCSVEFTAKIKAPGVTTAALYRFQNIADIHTSELPVKRVQTPPYLFSISGGVPIRNETGPN